MLESEATEAIPSSLSPTSLEVDEIVQEQGDENIFEKKVDIPRLKKYYPKLKKNTQCLVWCMAGLLVAILYFGFVEIVTLWGGSWVSSFSFSWLTSLKSVGLWAQIPSTGGIASLFLSILMYFLRKKDSLRRIKDEHNLCKSKYYPTSITPVLYSRVISLFAARINIFWICFTLIGLGIVSMIYAHVYAGVQAVSSSSSSGWDAEWYSKWFRSTKPYDWMALGGLLGIGAGFFFLVCTNPLLRLKIRKLLSIFGLNEYNMGQDLRDRAFHINKRDKIVCLVILCVIGFGIYIIFRRVIISIFNRSFRYSKR